MRGKRDRESSYVNGDCRVELRSYLSEPELPGTGTDQVDPGYLTLQRRGLSGSSSRINQYGVTSYSLRGDSALSTTERPKSALERLCLGEYQPDHLPQRGRMSVEEQLERMKRHQRALVRERKRNMSQGERHPEIPHPHTTHKHLPTITVYATEGVPSQSELMDVESEEELDVREREGDCYQHHSKDEKGLLF
ncbi:pleckstrin homology domain-containing family A member 7-like [Cyprinus carpio]|uniref:Pleckstrin homology domain-containing family A member 7-like n=1 Tax=Cyprinus carpio TaxID=7962 RepID=A0A9Q9Z241_CYPCA|nr:pleckstrin homology domain-containing family A member 7-like [Cyprinus carpio]XP_042630635.1 pleckstrin homology domain-containing family A member 7-like [Cyprinus carpio]